ncbi:unnamed protein product [Prorocentrum cordatum]|uniref:Uncharacterized protein n=1 Tax=Prorocentrum cordatum TaxID=2364126 RepID=A0ABN9SIE8_9DINO|nr:unnamed protein product [Polarella glacialis]
MAPKMSDSWHKKWRAFKEMKADHEKNTKTDTARKFEYTYKKIFMWTSFRDNIGELLADIMEDAEGDDLKARIFSLRGAVQTLEDMAADVVDASVGAFASKFAAPTADRPWKWTLTHADLARGPVT